MPTREKQFKVKVIDRIPLILNETKKVSFEASQEAGRRWLDAARNDLNNAAKHPHATGMLRDSLILKVRKQADGRRVLVSISSDKPYAREEEHRWGHSYLNHTRWFIGQSYGGLLSAMLRKGWKKYDIR